MKADTAIDRKVLIEPHYFGSLEYFTQILFREELQLEINQNYSKQTYKNRMKLLGPQGVHHLSIPVHYKNHMPLKDVRIDYEQNWVKVHLGFIHSAYGKAPFFEHYYPIIEEVFSRRDIFLKDFLTGCLTTCLYLLGHSISFSFTEKYVEMSGIDILDLREQITVKKDYQLRHYYRPETYHQNFGNKFVNNLSILDALMCTGPACRQIIEKSAFSN
ncbi:MAG: hypothetical protein ACI9RP_000518 [Cyclobacteriaceae bacterium]